MAPFVSTGYRTDMTTGDVLSEVLETARLHVREAIALTGGAGRRFDGPLAAIALAGRLGAGRSNVPEGDLLFMAAGSEWFAPVRASDSGVVLQFAFATPFDHPFFENLPRRARVTAPDELRHLGEALFSHVRAQQPGVDLLRRTLGNAIFVLAIRALGAQLPEYRTPMRDLAVYEAIRRIHADPGTDWNAESLAAAVGVSRASLYRRFESSVGTSPGEYLTTWRMVRARELLRLGDASMAEVADAVGYRSTTSFSRAFGRHHGVAPSTWRAGARQSVGSAQPPSASQGRAKR
jgi:AraC-like DNA-binding protein